MEEVAFERRKIKEVSSNIAPLLDIVLLLLIFFILSSNFVSSQGIKVNLPKGKGSSQVDKERTTISINKNHNVFVDEHRVALVDLAEKLPIARKIFINADQEVDIGFVVKVMEMAKKSKAKGIVISTRMAHDSK